MIVNEASKAVDTKNPAMRMLARDSAAQQQAPPAAVSGIHMLPEGGHQPLSYAIHPAVLDCSTHTAAAFASKSAEDEGMPKSLTTSSFKCMCYCLALTCWSRVAHWCRFDTYDAAIVSYCIQYKKFDFPIALL